jgi:hypothetical protein
MKQIYFIIVALCLPAVSCRQGQPQAPAGGTAASGAEHIIVYPAPSNEPLNDWYAITADGREVPVYNVKVASATNDPDAFELAALSYFDLIKGPVDVEISAKEDIRLAEVFPASAGIVPEINGGVLRARIDNPCNLTFCINGDTIHSCHLFVNPPETDAPDPNDPDVVYFGPGSYRLPQMELEDGMTVYVAGGAVVHCYAGPHEWYTVNDRGYKNYNKFYTYDLRAKNVTFRGRGIIDQDDIPAYGRRSVHIQGENIALEGVIFRSPSEWTVVVEKSKNVRIDNVKLIGHRPCMEGIDVSSSEQVSITNSFIRSPLSSIPVRIEGKEEVSAGNVVYRHISGRSRRTAPPA